MTLTDDEGEMMKTSWKFRRRTMFVCLAFFMAVVSYVLITELDTNPAETAVLVSLGGIVSIVGSYVFGAVWDDKSNE